MPNQAAKSSEQQGAEKRILAVEEAGGPFVTAATLSRMPMVFSDPRLPGNPIIYANDSFLALTKYDHDEMLGQSFHFLMGPDTDPAARAALNFSIYDSFSNRYPEVPYYRKDGIPFWAVLFVGPVLNKSGVVVQHFASFVDITDRRKEYERLQFLLNELNHRTQNMLATVQAIAMQTLRGATSEQVLEAFEKRILALSKAHTLLGRKNWQLVGLREVAGQILRPFGFESHGVSRVSIEGDDVRLRPKAALTLAMVFHELATNAAKYGALSNGGDGQIDIAWQVERTPQGDRMQLRWQERGGPPVTPPSRKGFGSRLIEGGLTQELDGEVRLDYEPAGMVCQIAMPVPVREWGDAP